MTRGVRPGSSEAAAMAFRIVLGNLRSYRTRRRSSVVCTVCWMVFALGIATLPNGLRAENYPSRPIRLVVPYPAGGAADIVARLYAERMTTNWNTIVVESKPGANGNIAADVVFNSPPDGYTLLVASGFLAVNPVFQPSLRWDHSAFVPIGLLSEGPPNVFAVPPNSPYGTLKEVVEEALRRPGQVNVGTASLGSSNHLGLELFYSAAGIDTYSVPYNGAAPALLALMRGEVELSLLSAPMTAPQARDNRLKVLAVSSTSRSSLLSDVPTVGEAGYPDAVLLPWFGVVAPPGTPTDVVRIVNAQINRALKDPALTAKLDQMGAVAPGGTPEQFQEHIHREARLLRRLIEQRNIRIN